MDDSVDRQCHRGDHLVGPPLELAQHPERVGRVLGFLEYFIAGDDRGVRPQDERARHAQRFLTRESLHIVDGRLDRPSHLGEV